MVEAKFGMDEHKVEEAFFGMSKMAKESDEEFIIRVENQRLDLD